MATSRLPAAPAAEDTAMHTATRWAIAALAALGLTACSAEADPAPPSMPTTAPTTSAARSSIPPVDAQVAANKIRSYGMAGSDADIAGLAWSVCDALTAGVAPDSIKSQGIGGSDAAATGILQVAVITYCPQNSSKVVGLP